MTHPNVKDLTARTFGRLKVIDHAPRPADAKGRGAHWQCLCECGNFIYVRSDSLVQGWTTSCGCTNESAARARAAIKPRRPKSTVSEHTEQSSTKTTLNTDLNMSENQGTYSNTVGVKLEDLQALRNRFSNLTQADLLPASQAAIAWLDDAIAKRAPAEPANGSYSNENDKPKNGLMSMSEQLRKEGFPVATGNLAAGEALDVVRAVKGTPGEEWREERTALRWKPIAQNLSERKHSHYFKPCPYDFVDVYRVLDLFGITDQAIGHALKKLLVAGGRGAGKSIEKDIQEAIDTLTRFLEMRREDQLANEHYLSLLKA